MKTGLIGALCFAGGFSIGMFYAKSICEKHYYAMLDEAYESFDEKTRESINEQEREDQDNNNDDSPVEHSEDPIAEPYENDASKYDMRELLDPDNFVIITLEELCEDSGEEVVDIYYNPSNDSYVDSEGNMLLRKEVEICVGKDYVYSFGIGSNNPDLVFVLNKRRKTKYALHRLRPRSEEAFDDEDSVNEDDFPWMSSEEDAELYNDLMKEEGLVDD